jgi:hypothetical protein
MLKNHKFINAKNYLFYFFLSGTFNPKLTHLYISKIKSWHLQGICFSKIPLKLQPNQENESQGETYIKHEQQQYGGGLPQSAYVAPSGGVKQSWDGGKKRIICDRNVTTGASGGRLRRQASCEDVVNKTNFNNCNNLNCKIREIPK